MISTDDTDSARAPRRGIPRMDPSRIKLAIEGDDPKAFEELYRCYRPTVQFAVAAWLRRVPALRSHQKDIESQVWFRLLNHDRRLLRSYDEKRASFQRFIELVAVGTAWRVASAKRLLPRLWSPEIDPDELSGPWSTDDNLERLLIRGDLITKLSQMVANRLAPEDLAVLRGLGLGGRSAKEVASELGVKEAAVYQRFARLKKKLRDYLTELTQDSSEPTGKTSHPAELLSLCLFILAFDLAHGGPASESAKISQIEAVMSDYRGGEGYQ